LATEVIDLHSIGNRADQYLIGKAMNRFLAEERVTIGVEAPFPDPTTGGAYLRPCEEPFFCHILYVGE
jgi:hypothetical protein